MSQNRIDQLSTQSNGSDGFVEDCGGHHEEFEQFAGTVSSELFLLFDCGT
jgi:hypothetical protein